MKPAKIGIDAGGSLLKMAFEEQGQIHYKSYSIDELYSSMNWLKMTAADAPIALTGGKAEYLKNEFFQNSRIVPEFESSGMGASYFMKKDGLSYEKFLLISIGTGTSICLNSGGRISRVSGSGIGGGTLMGLGRLLTGEKDFSAFVSLACSGKAENADLMVKDIYAPFNSPIDGSLTASNFGKIKDDHVSKEDKAASLTNMIAETIVLLSTQASVQHQVGDIIYIGSTVQYNEPLKHLLKKYTSMLGKNPVFIQNGAYCGAIGAMLSL
ncbi:pantothenate kinase [Cytobacillus firmus]|uniref:Pantothenate kinase n=2 Tax=Cytobacillus TaxID=2675230 RepID=A0A366JSD0_CYTFI|nr:MULTISPECIES: type II pantothenate kinase [Cytobacillus]RBP90551.1 pantothenate kinase [Cytobacillus firmus]TDX46133.1 pantothenate kinase [Cytobacillus oceanisediminis]